MGGALNRKERSGKPLWPAVDTARSMRLRWGRKGCSSSIRSKVFEVDPDCHGKVSLFHVKHIGRGEAAPQVQRVCAAWSGFS